MRELFKNALSSGIKIKSELQKKEYTDSFEIIGNLMVGAIITVGIATYFILRSSFLITKFLGASGINAISRIVGFIVIAIGVEYIIGSVLNILTNIIV